MSLLDLQNELRKAASEIVNGHTGLFLVEPHSKLDYQEISNQVCDLEGRILTPKVSYGLAPSSSRHSRDEQRTASRFALVSAVESIPNAEPFHASICHTEGVAGALVAADSIGLLGVGIDIESRSRQLSHKLQKWLVAHSLAPSEEPLQIWCGFEATFKSDPTDAKGSFADYVPVETRRFRKGEVEFRTRSVMTEGWTGAVCAAYRSEAQ